MANRRATQKGYASIDNDREVIVIPRERCAYSAIVDRPPLVLPNRARLVVWTIVNLEFWDIARPMARQVLPAPTGQVLVPDVPNWAWHEYGMRVGVWRFFELFSRLAIRPTLSINARVCEEYERVARAARDAGWEFMGHAWEQMPIHQVEDQFAMINQSLGMLERAGELPAGLSGGQRLRVAIAWALANGPTLLRADEPTGALDSAGAAEVLDLFRQLNARGQTIVVVTHSAEVATGASRVVRMRDGRVEAPAQVVAELA